MTNLELLAKHVKCGISLLVNEHRNYYESVQDYISVDADDIPREILDKMIETDTVIQLQLYPNTPIGSYMIWHYDIDAAISQALTLVKHDD